MAGAEIRILIVEDDRAHAEALELALDSEGYQVEIADSTDSALDRLRARPFDLVLTDLMLGDRDGLELLREARRIMPDLSIFLITGHGSIETAVQAMREGAADYLTKPVNLAELRTRVARELEKRELAADNRALRAELDQRFGMEGIVGNSPPIKQVFDLLRQVGPTDATVLLLGESGTGKELIARACHRLSARSKRRFVAINCAALTDSLIESELFGHTKGAFTGAHSAQEGKFQYAHGGTLFLDEIGDMPLGTQAKLLRVLEEAEVTPVGSNVTVPIDVRIVAATNQNLFQRVEQGRFRQDLYYRLAVVSIDLPPLRARPDDLELLVDHFRADFAKKHNKDVSLVQDQVIQHFRAYPWPGNVRELRNAVETMVVLDRDGELGMDDVPMSMRQLPAANVAQAGPVAYGISAQQPGLSSKPTIPPALPSMAELPAAGYELAGKSLEAVERDLIQATLKMVHGNRQKAAEQLGMGERTLYRKIKEYDLN